jgi:predicted DNA-binding transcriptional regulator AlpA
MARQSALPPTLPPRLLTREQAAAYLSVAPGTFDKLVETGRMPPARRVSEGRIAWDRWEIDRSVDALPTEGASAVDETWGDVDAA